MDDADFPLNLKDFHCDLTSHARELKLALADDSKDQMFSSRIEKRGDNLLKGGNVLQVGAHHLGLQQWIVQFKVGAQMKGVDYNCYLRLQVGTKNFDTACECTGGCEISTVV